MRRLLLSLLLASFLILLPAAAQDAPLAPEEIRGEVVYIPYPVPLTLDGDLSDWAGVPWVTVDRGTQLSPDPANNGSFRFALASDGDRTLFVAMTSVDGVIVTGQHGPDFWNEDSLEFYLNLTGDFGADAYDSGIFQVNINPGDIGLADPAAVTLSGTNATSSGTRALVFATPDGWGFEAAVPLPFSPSHGLEIGLQAHANGSNEGSRSVKLIWSNADTADASYNTPSVFGRGLFFSIGSDDIPQPSVVIEEVPLPFIAVNQTGYAPSAIKIAVYPYASTANGTAFTLVDTATNASVYAGFTAPGFLDDASGDTVSLIDFSAFTTPGTYILRVNDAVSVPFRIASGLYAPLAIDALRYFYLNRSGIELTADHAGQPYARPAGHLTDNAVTCFNGTDAAGRTWPGCDYRLDASGGWYDAGDYGKYVVNAGISAWTLLNLYERFPDAVPDSALNIPESGDGIPDVLSEARWEVDWMLRMQIPAGQPNAGLVHHKLHGLQWDGLPQLPAPDFDVNDPARGRYLMPVSTAATLNLAAVAAQCARIWRDIDPAFADRCLTAAVTAYDAAIQSPGLYYDPQVPGNGGGPYDDQNLADEFFWAAAELLSTTGERLYLNGVLANVEVMEPAGFEAGQQDSLYWGDVTLLALIRLATGENIPADIQADARTYLLSVAGHSAAQLSREGYRTPLADYAWGSNSDALNKALVMAYAYDLTADPVYRDAVILTMDWILGRNALNFSFVSGYGTHAMQHPHHRVWADSPNGVYPPVPPGALAGGPNSNPSDTPAMNPEVAGQPRAKRYIDHIDSYSTNEVAINWNAPLAWVAAWLNQME